MPGGMVGMGGSAMQGLQSAAPAAPEAVAPAAGPEQAMAVLQDAVAQYGPGIVEILKQILSEGGEGSTGVGMMGGGGMGGMM